MAREGLRVSSEPTKPRGVREPLTASQGGPQEQRADGVWAELCGCREHCRVRASRVILASSCWEQTGQWAGVAGAHTEKTV